MWAETAHSVDTEFNTTEEISWLAIHPLVENIWRKIRGKEN